MPYCVNCKKDAPRASDSGSYWTCACGAKITSVADRFCGVCDGNTYSYAISNKTPIDRSPWWLCVKHDRETYSSAAAAKRKDLGVKIMGWLFLILLAICVLGFVASQFES